MSKPCHGDPEKDRLILDEAKNATIILTSFKNGLVDIKNINTDNYKELRQQIQYQERELMAIRHLFETATIAFIKT